MIHKIEYIDDDSIMVRRVRGKAEFSDIFCSWSDLIKNNEIKPAITGIINDFRDVELIMNIADVKKLITLFEENTDIFGGKKIAVVVDSYKNIFFPMVGQKFTSKMQVRPFSTYEAAYNWVKGLAE